MKKVIVASTMIQLLIGFCESRVLDETKDVGSKGVNEQIGKFFPQMQLEDSTAQQPDSLVSSSKILLAAYQDLSVKVGQIIEYELTKPASQGRTSKNLSYVKSLIEIVKLFPTLENDTLLTKTVMEVALAFVQIILSSRADLPSANSSSATGITSKLSLLNCQDDESSSCSRAERILESLQKLDDYIKRRGTASAVDNGIETSSQKILIRKALTSSFYSKCERSILRSRDDAIALKLVQLLLEYVTKLVKTL